MESVQNSNITFFGQTSFRGKQVKFGIKRDDKRRHIYIIGKTGMGKTELLKNMITQDIRKGNGVCFVDPHGDAAEELLQFIPEDRVKDVVYFNPADLENPIAFNIMEDVSAEYRHLIAGGIMAVFKKIWPDVWSSRMEYILNNCLLALLEVPGSTLLGINKMLSNPEWRETIVNQVKDPIIKAFWTKEFARYSQRYETEATAAIQNKIGQFISSPIIRNIIGQPTSSMNMREIMDSKKIFIVNLSKGRVGEESSRLLGALLITKLQLAAMSRVDIPEETRNDFMLYIDEFQNFSTDSFASILSEARKYRLSLILAHQYIAQMEEKVRDAVFGNVGTMIVFRVGADDAEFLEKEFSPEFMIEDIVNLPKQSIYLKLMIDGVSSRPFSANTLPPAKKNGESMEQEIIDFSRINYATPLSVVEIKIAKDTEDDGDVGEAREQAPSRAGGLELHDTVCQSCDKKMKVPFKPDGKRPVYCKSCLKKMEVAPAEKTFKKSEGFDSRKPREFSEAPKSFEAPKSEREIPRTIANKNFEPRSNDIRQNYQNREAPKRESLLENRKEEFQKSEDINSKNIQQEPTESQPVKKESIPLNAINESQRGEVKNIESKQAEPIIIEATNKDISFRDIASNVQKSEIKTPRDNYQKESNTTHISKYANREVQKNENKVLEVDQQKIGDTQILNKEQFFKSMSDEGGRIENKININSQEIGMRDLDKKDYSYEEKKQEVKIGENKISSEKYLKNETEKETVVPEINNKSPEDKYHNSSIYHDLKKELEIGRDEVSGDIKKNGRVASLEESAKKYIPEEKVLRRNEPNATPRKEIVADEPTKLETRSGKKIDFEGLLDIIKKEKDPAQKNSSSGGVIKPGETIKFD